MKKLFLLIAGIALATACNKNTEPYESPVSDTNKPDTVMVSLAMTGEITIDETPWTDSKAAGEETASQDLYGISVYYDKDRDGCIDDVYGYGLFDNINDMTISLLTGYKYKFICSLVKDGKKMGQYKTGYGRWGVSSYFFSISSYSGYGYPFLKSQQSYRSDPYNYKTDINGTYRPEYSSDYSYYYGEAPTILGNRFICGDGYHLTGLGQGYSGGSVDYNDGKSGVIKYANAYPIQERYYGEITDYTPVKGGVVNIEMKRCVFGIKFNITGITDGEFTVTINDKMSDSEQLVSKTFTANQHSDDATYAYRNVYDCWLKTMNGQEYSQDFTMTLTWKRGNGVTQTLDPRPITFKRNMLSTVNIVLNGGSSDNSLNMDIEDSEMGQESIDFNIDAGDMTETPVEPTV